MSKEKREKEEKEKKPKKPKKPKKEIKIGNGISLGEKWQKGLFSVLFTRFGLVLIMLIAQIALLLMIWGWFEQIFTRYIVGGQTIIVLMVMIYVLNTSMDSTAKLSWMLLISAMPLFGTMLFLWTRTEIGHREIKLKLAKMDRRSRRTFKQDDEIIEKIKKSDTLSASLANYIYNIGGNPAHEMTEVEYFPLGDDKFLTMIDELRKAKDFIFLEYFIIEEGHMWGNVLEVLAQKAKLGVEVKVMYDGTCEFTKLPYNYPKMLKKFGIECKMWEPIKPVVTSTYNYRDHRKILVIDGKTAFCGGINLADEYINIGSKFGHWKDSAIMLKGSAVDNLTLMFLQMWNVTEKDIDKDEFSKYFNHYEKNPSAKGYIIPYGESPLNDHKIAEAVYMDMLNTARKYVYIMTPYLVLDDELSMALRYAAEKGVDVRLILPGIPDKKLVWALSKSHYKRLVSAGVKIYEYTPGFVHSKIFLSDDRKAVVGTINLDYRSLYHHFECGAYMLDIPCIEEIAEDFEETFEKCRRITPQTIKHEKVWIKFFGAVMKLIAPLL